MSPLGGAMVSTRGRVLETSCITSTFSIPRTACPPTPSSSLPSSTPSALAALSGFRLVLRHALDEGEVQAKGSVGIAKIVLDEA